MSLSEQYGKTLRKTQCHLIKTKHIYISLFEQYGKTPGETQLNKNEIYSYSNSTAESCAKSNILSQQNSITDVNFYQLLTSIYPQPRGRTYSP